VTTRVFLSPSVARFDRNGGAVLADRDFGEGRFNAFGKHQAQFRRRGDGAVGGGCLAFQMGVGKHAEAASSEPSRAAVERAFLSSMAGSCQAVAKWASV
jgi:hypothetical protein